MMGSPDVTRILEAVGQGDAAASEELLPLVYDELRRLARARLAGKNQTLQPTELVHEAYLRLVKEPNLSWDNRGHFFAAAAESMRRILIERYRRAGAEKHGGKQQRITFSGVDPGYEARPEEVLALDEALTRLEEKDETMAQLVKLRYFAGLTQDETAQAMGVSRRTVNRLWVAARAWLGREMRN